MSSTTKVICDSCGSERAKDTGHLSYDTGWYMLGTQWPGDWGDTRKDFCSLACVNRWVEERVRALVRK